MASPIYSCERRMTMKVVYKTCCVVDVHKSFLVATIIKTTNGVQPSYRKERFSTFNGDIRRFKKWLLDNDCHDVCMESTGKYWIPVFNILEGQVNVTIATPNGSKPSRGIRMTPRIPNGSATFSGSASSLAASSLTSPSASSGNIPATASSSFPVTGARRTATRTLSLSVMLRLIPLSLTCSENPLLPLQIIW